MYDSASELYNDLLVTYFDEYNDLSDDKRNKMGPEYKPEELILEGYDYSVWSKNEEKPTDK